MPHENTKNEYVLKTTCPAGSGIVAAVSGFLAEKGCYISEQSQFDDVDSGTFFMRTRFNFDGDDQCEAIKAGFEDVAIKFGMDWTLKNACSPVKTLIMVSKADHCLADLLYRKNKGDLNMEITAVVSNHQDLRPMAEREGIRFVHLPITKENKLDQEQVLLDIVEETGSELVVLARYMQILSNSLCAELKGRAINIHHSFLPGFKGARPYYQAYDRGVKLIGATAHYVTADLDEGPIIEQSVQTVDHTMGPEQLTSAGRDTETVALARAVKLHTQHRVFIDGNKTVVFK
ncbi:formyltetrahydrofolate deformylase [Oceanobacter mangrovi]|uniref:formyltetrahydrofolate deformylase n=1 Tax=Oceanobacter mangrovi TaxID=2862510 RepID=UPI001C8E80A5|nr:formyltetrahydrofolate deformylase [Oceanobacter mangrovi]